MQLRFKVQIASMHSQSARVTPFADIAKYSFYYDLPSSMDDVLGKPKIKVGDFSVTNFDATMESQKVSLQSLSTAQFELATTSRTLPADNIPQTSRAAKPSEGFSL